ncbi:hypothetical protein [Thermocrinis minervae]|uniref:Uncharacterized protein n=1 Tax=Thermocrinis minervae TaxID=381751 RepID=A0A1M6TGG2_9AQUI|nr:hypothetical protein [Thermocrinis minervae]SHK56122.1 hypothetical protein SAMN05444391_1454 [Thermocrinis minervae]
MDVKKVLRYTWQGISFLLILYGLYLLFLLFLDTFLRVLPGLAYPLSFLLTLGLLAFVVLYWIKNKRLPL